LDEEQAALTGLLHDAAKDFLPAGAPLCCYGSGTLAGTALGAGFLSTGCTDRWALTWCSTNWISRTGWCWTRLPHITFWGGGANFDHPLSWCLRFATFWSPIALGTNHARWLRAVRRDCTQWRIPASWKRLPVCTPAFWCTSLLKFEYTDQSKT
jgi:hypothetical protein